MEWRFRLYLFEKICQYFFLYEIEINRRLKIKAGLIKSMMLERLLEQKIGGGVQGGTGAASGAFQLEPAMKEANPSS